MQTELMTTEQLRLQVEKLWIQHIKLCQDNFLAFVQEVWPDFICRKSKKPEEWGHHQIIAKEFTDITDQRKGRLIINMPLDKQNHNSLQYTTLLGLLVSIQN